MKREDLKAIEGLTEEQINAVMRLHGLDAAAHQATVQGLPGAAGHCTAGPGGLRRRGR